MKSLIKILSVAVICFIIAVSIQMNSRSSIIDNKIYVVKDKEKNISIQNIGERVNTKGYNSFTRGKSELLDNIFITGENVITLSPDNKAAFVIEKSTNFDIQNILKGSVISNVYLFKINLLTGYKTLIAKNIPFISTIKWNKEGSMVGFCGGSCLLIYDYKNSSLLYDSRIRSEEVAYFGWSPDGRKVYTEHPGIANGSVIYIDSGKILSSYETKDDQYYKGVLDKNYYYITKSDLDQNIYGQTCIVDYRGNIIKTIPEYGIFRDQFKRSVIEVGEYKFGLIYYKDINDLRQYKLLTKEYVYDAKFVYNGRIAFIIKNPYSESNKFLLIIANSNGNILQKISVGSSSFVVSPDGTYGYISNPNLSRLNFVKLSANKYINENIKYKYNYYIISTLRGAIDTYFNNYMTGLKDYKSLKKYFIDSSNPDQWAYFEMENKWQWQSPKYYLSEDLKYNIEAKVHNVNIYRDKMNVLHASCYIEASANNSIGDNENISTDIEIVNKNRKWYVTGISTFPRSDTTRKTKLEVEKLLAEAKKQKLFDGIVSDKKVSIGEIQFLANNQEIDMSNNPENADYCKVLLKEYRKNKTYIYVMLLSKEYDENNIPYWKMETIDNQKMLLSF